jgi:hypothetical protein
VPDASFAELAPLLEDGMTEDTNPEDTFAGIEDDGVGLKVMVCVDVGMTVVLIGFVVVTQLRPSRLHEVCVV